MLKWYQIAIEKLFTNQPVTENKAVINVKTVQIRCSISQPRLHISKNPSIRRCSIWYRSRNFSLNFKKRNSKSEKWILVMLSITVTCCTNIYILIRSPLKMKFLHLLWKFHGYIFNGLGEKWIWKLPPAILPVDFKQIDFVGESGLMQGHFPLNYNTML